MTWRLSDDEIRERGPEHERWIIAPAEVAQQLLDVAIGTTAFTLEREWADVFAGDVVMRLATGWVITIFNDCDDFDYIDSVLAPDGREQDDWSSEKYGWFDPSWLLQPQDARQLEERLRRWRLRT